MLPKTIPLALSLLAAVSLGACAEGPHKQAMMGGGMMGNGMAGKQTDCSMMQKDMMQKGMAQKDMAQKDMAQKDMAKMSGCSMMNKAAKDDVAKAPAPAPENKPGDSEDHAAHHPGG